MPSSRQHIGFKRTVKEPSAVVGSAAKCWPVLSQHSSTHRCPLSSANSPTPLLFPTRPPNSLHRPTTDAPPTANPHAKRYSDLLAWRTTNPKSTQQIRDQAAPEKKVSDQMNGAEKERWAILKAWKDTDATAGVVGNGAAPPGMV